MSKTDKRDYEAEITNKILAIMESEEPLKWLQPWRDCRLNPFHHCNAETGHQYRSINAIMTAIIAEENGYAFTGWMTFNQAKKLGGMVRKGEKGTPLTFSKKLAFKDAETDKTKSIFMRKFYTVFNIAQIDGLPDKYYIQPAAIIDHPGDAQIEDWIKNIGADIRLGGNRAFYRHKSAMGKDGDFIQMPLRKQFKDINNYYSTLFHELAHWTGDSNRLNRDKTGGFGSVTYAKEEFVAEIGSVFLAAHLGVEHDLSQTAAYLESWRKAMRDDKKFIFTAASAANRAAEYIIEQAETETEDAPAPAPHVTIRDAIPATAAAQLQLAI